MSSTPNVPTWQAEFNQRVQTFSEAIGVEEAAVRKALSEYGADGQSAQSLDIIDSDEALPMSELFQMFVDSGLTQKGKLRIAVPHLRGKTSLEDVEVTANGGFTEVAGAIKDMVAANRPKADWTDDELLRAYDETSSEIWDILRKRSHGRPFVIFNSNGTVNIEESAKLLKIAKRQPTANRHKINGKLVHVFRAGDFLERMLDESPFCRGISLVDGYCSESDTNWTGISDEARIICHLHAFKVETSKLSKREMRQIAKLAQDLSSLREELPEASLMYDELKEQDSLPKLKIREKSSRPTTEYLKRTDTGF